MAEQIQLRRPGVGYFLVAIKMFARSLMAFLKAKLAADALQLFEGGGIDAVSCLKAQRIDPRPAAQVGALCAGLVPLPERRSGGDQGDAAIGRVKISRRARFGEIFTAARVDNSSGVEVFEISEYAGFAVVISVIVGATNQVDPEPFQVFEQLWLGGHERPLRDTRRAFVPSVHGAFEIGKACVGTPQNVAQLEKALLFERRQFARQHGVTSKGDGEMAFFCLVDQCVSSI